MTFRTFMAPDELFDMLVGIYRMCYPKNLTESEFVEWRERCLHPTQFMVLTVFTMWLEEHRLLEEEPHISRRLIEFLALIKPPSPLTVTAQSIIQSITRLVSNSSLILRHSQCQPFTADICNQYHNNILPAQPSGAKSTRKRSF